MMKKLLFNLLLLIMVSIGAVAQETLTVNDGTETSGYVPVYGFYTDAYLKCEFVIPAVAIEEMANGTISSMKFYLSSTANASWGNANFQVFMKEVAETTISEYSGTEGATIVYEGALDGTQSEMSISFTSDFEYNGGNLLVGVYNTVKGTYNSAKFYGATTEGACVQGYNYDYLASVPANQRNFLPKTTFTYTPGPAPSCPRPTDLIVSDVAARGASLSWTAGGSETAWQICLNDDEENLIDVTANSYTLADLTPETAYTVKVRAICGVDDVSIWTANKNFTTLASCPRPTDLIVSDIAARGASLSWTAGGSETAWQICLNDDEENLIDVTANSYTLSDLTPETAYTVKVRAICGVDDVSVWGSSVSFTTLVSCPVPTDLEIVAMTDSSTTLSWTAGGSETAWNLQYKTSSDADWTVVSDVTSNPYTITGLTAETNYDVQVQADCSDDDQSEWSYPLQIYTGYCQPAPESVDGEGIINVTFGIGDNIVNNSDVLISEPYYGNYSNLVGAIQAGVEAVVSITYATGYTYGTIIWIDLNNNLVFDGEEIVYAGESTYANPTTLDAIFTLPASTPVGDYRMRIAGSDSYYDSYIEATSDQADPCPDSDYDYTIVHDYTVRVLEAPSCIPPTGLTALNSTIASATIAWAAGADESAWQICVNDDEENLIDVTDTIYEITGLEPATIYDIKVRANCGDDDFSTWTRAIQIVTSICPSEEQCSISYVLEDGYGDGWNGNAINVIDVETGLIIASLTIEDGYEESGSLAVCNGRELSFEWVMGYYPDEPSYTITDVNGDEIFSGYEAFLSNFSYTPICSSCRTPYDLQVSNITASAAELSWTARGVEGEWQICINGDEENIVTVTEAAFEMTNLAEETNYTVKVRANCGEEQSAWISIDFTTLATCPDPENVVATTTNSSADLSWDAEADSYIVRYAPQNTIFFDGFENGLTDEWTSIDADGDGHTWVLASELTNYFSAHSGEDMLSSESTDYNNDIALNPDNWLVSPQISLPDADSILLRFYASAMEWAPAEYYGVYVSTTTTAPSAFTLLWEEYYNGGVYSLGDWDEKNTDLTAYAGQNVYIAIRHFNSTAMSTLNIDDFGVYYTMNDEWQETNTTEPSVELTGLEANTQYICQMNSVCGSSESNSWTETTFVTENNTYTITATAGENGTISPAYAIVDEGDDFDIMIEAADGYRVESVIVDADTDNETDVTAELNNGVYTFANVTANHTIYATFVAIPAGEYVVTVNAAENGTVTPNGTQTVAEGSNFTFTVTPDDCYAVVAVVVNGLNVDLDSNNQYTIENITEDQVVDVFFEMTTYTILASSEGSGIITPDMAIVNCGADKSFYIMPNAGYRIASVIVDADTDGEADVTAEVVEGIYTFANVSSDHSIAVIFEQIPVYTITATAGENGTITPSGDVDVVDGNDQAFVIAPDENYQIDVLAVDGVALELTAEQLAGYTYTFEAVDADHTIDVTFVSVSGAEMFEAASMAIYPNPNNGMFSIDFSGIEGGATYQLIDARGAVVEARNISVANGETINFNHNLNAGTYFVRIISTDKVYVEQIVVE